MRDRLVSRGCSLLLMLTIGMSACTTEQTDPQQVIPGEGIGVIALGDSRMEVLEKAGEPMQADSEQVADSLYRDEWVRGDAVVSALFYNVVVIQVQVDGPAFNTPAGLSGYSSISEIRTVYPDMNISVMAHDMENMYLDDVDRGIAFSVRGAREHELANEDGDVINVFVHLPGEEVIAVVHHHDEHH